MLIETITFNKDKFFSRAYFFQWYSNDSYQFECQHGPRECYGNIVQACAINIFYDADDIFNYVTCLMKSVNPSEVTNDTYPVDKVSDIFMY